MSDLRANNFRKTFDNFTLKPFTAAASSKQQASVAQNMKERERERETEINACFRHFLLFFSCVLNKKCFIGGACARARRIKSAVHYF